MSVPDQFLKNIHSEESTQRKSKHYSFQENIFSMIPDSAFNSVSVVWRAEGVVKFYFIFTLFSHWRSFGILETPGNSCSCILKGDAVLCRQSPALQLIPSHFADAWCCDRIEAYRISHLCLIIFPCFLQRICFCKNCLYGRGRLDVMSSKAHHQFLLLLESAPHPSKHGTSFRVLLTLACQQMRSREGARC